MRIHTTRAFALLAVFNMAAFGWTVSSDFEKGPLGGQVAEMGTTTGKYSNVTAASGSKSVAFTIDSLSDGFGRFGGIVKYPKELYRNDEIWVRISTYFPTGFDYDANPFLKFLRQHVATSQGKHVGYDDLYIANHVEPMPFQFIWEGELKWHRIGTRADSIVPDTWETYEMYIKFDSLCADSGGNAVVRVWKNGKLLGNITDRRTLESGSDRADAAYFFTYWNGSAPKKQTMYVDDMIITSELPSALDADGHPYLGVSASVEIHPAAKRTSAAFRRQGGSSGPYDVQGREARPFPIEKLAPRFQPVKP